MTTTARQLIETLGLSRHPEGGWYAETFRDAAGPSGRAHSTAIYFLLEAHERSHWHRVDAAEVWLFHAGAPLELGLSDDGRACRTVRLGLDVASGERPQAVVPPGAWQSAKTLGDYTLVSCTVAPGFDFARFELAPPGWSPG
ncbi:MAG: cupin domain-containing protein [Myxococcaceae bacterium]|nr:cupin domain-containing protein [Myxococcaceae bacterium]